MLTSATRVVATASSARSCTQLRPLFRQRRVPLRPLLTHPQCRAHSSTSFHHKSLRRQDRSHSQQSNSYTIVITAAAVGAGAYLYRTVSSSSQEPAPAEPVEQKLYSPSDQDLHNLAAMSGIEVGHLGNLTAEQEIKLRELWAATFKIFGVPAPEVDEEEEPPTNGVTPSATESSLTEKKKSKKRFSVFRKDKESKKKDDAPVKIKQDDSDDKYGQMKDFQNTLAKSSPEELRTTFWSMVKHDHPDQLLLRFLRARKWDVDKALVMMISAMAWRAQDMHLDDVIIMQGEGGALADSQSSDAAVKKEATDFLMQMRLGKSFLHGTDKAGRPMCFVRVKYHKAGEQSATSMEKYTVFMIETARMMLAAPVETAAVVFDMTGFSMANMDYTPVKFMIKCFEANYPESLGVVLIHNAPWIFQGVWKIIRGWLDPVVASKINFTSSVEDLEKFIEPTHIPKAMGGKEEWEYAYVEPLADENAAQKETEKRDALLSARADSVSEFQKLTHAWIAAGASGNDTSSLKSERDTLAKSLRAGYWDLDQYLRAKTLYDRTGIIKPGGKLQFYPDEKPKDADSNVELMEKVKEKTSENGPPATYVADELD